MISYLAGVKKELLASLLVQWRALAKGLCGTESLHVKNSKLGSTPGPPHDFSVSSLQGDRVSSERKRAWVQSLFHHTFTLMSPYHNY